MNKKRAAAVAGAVTATAVAAALAIGVNFGLFGLTSNTDRVGTIRPVDVPGAPLGAIAPAASTAAADPATTTDQPAVSLIPAADVDPGQAPAPRADRDGIHEDDGHGSSHEADD